jgi:hypothetical protein
LSVFDNGKSRAACTTAFERKIWQRRGGGTGCFGCIKAHLWLSSADPPDQWVDKVHQRRPPKTIVLDMDSSENPT